MKTKPTSEQLVDMLEDKLDITICADVVHGLDLEYKELQERINKALQFINKEKWNSSYEDDYDIYLCEEEINQLQKILKGEIK